MAPSTLNWTPEPHLLEQLRSLAQKRGQSLDTVLTEAIVTYLEAQKEVQKPEELELSIESDPLIGLFSGSPDLATRSEEMLQQEITRSGWTWK